MTSFEMVKYHKKDYPSYIPLHIEEIAAHFDISKIARNMEISLHTEYSYGKRKWDSSLVNNFSEIVAAQRKGIPQLWKNEIWALQFADFITSLVDNGSALKVIEIHPPFSDYTDITGFIRNYSVFESKITEQFPDVQILIENRFGSRYLRKGCSFVISTNRDVRLLCDEIANSDLRLRVAYDIPQIYSAHNAKTENEYIDLLEETKAFREYIGGVHLWGKCTSPKRRRVSHCGDLDSYFENIDIKNHFLATFRDCFDDGITRKMVLEVNSGNEDMKSIILDLKSVGIVFI